jgi:hypothetical protein
MGRARSGHIEVVSTGNRLTPNVWPEDGTNFAHVSQTRAKSPGPIYNLQAQVPDQLLGCSRQLSTATCKDVSFAYAMRMPEGMAMIHTICFCHL